jgi:hypothetical protein
MHTKYWLETLKGRYLYCRYLGVDGRHFKIDAECTGCEDVDWVHLV